MDAFRDKIYRGREMKIGDKVYPNSEHWVRGHDMFGKTYRDFGGSTITKITFMEADAGYFGKDYYLYDLSNGTQIASPFCQKEPFKE